MLDLKTTKDNLLDDLTTLLNEGFFYAGRMDGKYLTFSEDTSNGGTFTINASWRGHPYHGFKFIFRVETSGVVQTRVKIVSHPDEYIDPNNDVNVAKPTFAYSLNDSSLVGDISARLTSTLELLAINAELRTAKEECYIPAMATDSGAL